MDNQGIGAANAAKVALDSQKQKPRKRKGHRGGKKKRLRRKSFAALTEDSHDERSGASRSGLYQVPSASLSDASIDSEVLLDHRCV